MNLPPVSPPLPCVSCPLTRRLTLRRGAQGTVLLATKEAVAEHTHEHERAHHATDWGDVPAQPVTRSER